ncbi:MAG: hypothetical protein ACO25L_06300, partial [Candidatus Nanopelagicales bacterium]
MTKQNGFIDPAITIGAVGAVVVLGLLFIGGPQYNVWQQSLAGKSELARAEYNRQIKVQEAQEAIRLLRKYKEPV